jgi:hypothetical protein
MKKILLFTIFFCAFFAQAQVRTVTTTPPLNSNNGSTGVTFEIESTQPIKLIGLDVIFSSNTNAGLWMRTGGVRHSPSSGPSITAANGWTEVVQATAVTPAGSTSLDPLPFNGVEIIVPANTRLGFFVAGSVRYQTGLGTDQVIFSDGTLTVDVSDPIAYGGGLTTPNFNPRRFLGTVYYEFLVAGDCPEFSVINLDSIAAREAHISWTSGVGNTSFKVEYGPAQFSPGNGTVITQPIVGANQQVVLTGLDPFSDYEFFITEYCNGNQDSAYLMQPYQFKTIPACATPQSFSVKQIFSDSVRVAWLGYSGPVEMKFGPPGFDPDVSGNLQTGSGTEGLLTGLLSNTNYDVYVRGNCTAQNDGLSFWAGPIEITTVCPPTAAPIYQNFDGSGWIAGSGTVNLNSSFAACWNRFPDDESQYFWGTGSGPTNNNNSGPIGGASSGLGNYIVTQGSRGTVGSVAIFQSPLIDLSPLTNPVLHYGYHRFGNQLDTLAVEINNGQGWQELTHYVGPQHISKEDPWKYDTLSLTAFQGVVQIRFRSIRGSGANSDVGIDDFVVENAIQSDIYPLAIRPKGNTYCLTQQDTLMLAIRNNSSLPFDPQANPVNFLYDIQGPVNSQGTATINSGPTLAPGQEGLFPMVGIDLSQPGAYSANGYLAASAFNQSPFRDTLSQPFSIFVDVVWAVSPTGPIVIDNTTDTVLLEAYAGEFFGSKPFISEICHFRTGTGAPTLGWPSYLNADDYIEITGTPNGSLEGFTLEQWSNTSLLHSHQFPAGTLLSPNGTAIIAVGQLGSSVPRPEFFYYHAGYTGTFSSAGAAGRILKDRNGQIVDAVVYSGSSNYTFPAAAGVSSADWTGQTPSGSSTSGIRLIGPDLNSATNWVVSSSANPQDPNVLNAGVPQVVSANPNNILWSLDGQLIDTMPNIVVGPFYAEGTYHYVASYLSNCGAFVDTITVQVINLPGPDAAIEAVFPPDTFFQSGVQPVSVNLFNNGSDTLSTLTVKWEVNGQGQPDFNWTGTLPPGQRIDSIAIGTFDFVGGVIHDIKAYGHLPNGMPDGLPANDTAVLGNVMSALEGSFTIGGPTPDFQNFAEAIHALATGGIWDHVVMDIAEGTYQEQLDFQGPYQLRFPNITTTFQGVSGDSSLVVIEETSNVSSRNYVLQLADVSGLRFKNLTFFKSSTGIYKTVVNLNGSYVDDVHFENIHLSNVFPVNSTSTLRALVISSSSTHLNGLQFNRVFFENGSYGLYLIGNSSNRSNQFSITDCQFQNFFVAATYLTNTDSLTFHANNLYSESAYLTTSSYGLYIVGSATGEVTGNRIYSPDGIRYGIFLSNLSGTSQTPFLIANNEIGMGNSFQGYGMRLVSSSQVEISHNSIWYFGTNNSAAAMEYGSGNNNVEIYNNIFKNSGSGYSFQSALFSPNHIGDFNNYDASGAFSFRRGSTNVADLSNWQTAVSIDINSLAVDPQFPDSTDLRTGNVLLSAAGTPRPLVTTDIFGNPRNNVTPDIGAEEFTTVTNDAGLTALQSPAKPFVAGLTNVKVRLLNNGSDTLETAEVNWTVNGVVQPVYSWVGQLGPGGILDSVAIGQFNFVADSIYDVIAWVSNPNGQPDVQPLNDTVRAIGLATAMSGLYAIAPNQGDFSDFTSALSALQMRGISGWVTFEVASGTYNEQLIFRPVQGASPQDTILFKSVDGQPATAIIVFQPGTENYVLAMEGARHLRFQGLTFENTGAQNGVVLRYLDASTDITFEHIHFKTVRESTTQLRKALVISPSNQRSNEQRFMACVFESGSYGILAEGISSDSEAGWLVRESTFKDIHYRPLSIQHHRDLLIHQNLIERPNLFSNSFTGMDLRNVSGIEILQNRIGAPNTGIEGWNLSASSSKDAWIANNFISVESSINGSYGIRLTSSNQLLVAHNSIWLNNPGSNSAGFFDASAGSIQVLNNIFYSSQGAPALRLSNLSSAGFYNYNAYFSDADFGQIGSNLISDLATWRASTGNDNNSLLVNPGFAAADSLYSRNARLYRAGNQLVQFPKDIDNAPRPSPNPSIGAAEIVLPANDVAMLEVQGPAAPFSAGQHPVYIRFKNNGTDTLRTLSIVWQVNGVAQPTYLWSGVLPTGAAVDSLAIGQFNFAAGVFHDVVVWGEFPNNQQDAFPENDTTDALSLLPALSGNYFIGNQNADFDNFTEAAAALEIAGIAGWVTFSVQDGVYQDTVSLRPISGISPTDTVVFQSLSRDRTKVLLEGQVPTLVHIDDPRHMTFRDMTFKSTLNAASRLVHLNGPVTDVRFTGMHFEFGNNVSTFNNAIAIDLVGNQDHNGLLIEASSFTGGRFGVLADMFFGFALNRMQIRNCDFSGQGNEMVNLSRLTDVQISGNSFYRNSSVGINTAALRLNQALGPIKVSENRIHLPLGGTGMLLSNLDGVQTRAGLVSNNMISVGDSSANASRGFNVSSSQRLSLIHNTVYNGSSNSSTSSEGVRFTGSSVLEFLNNIVFHEGVGPALRIAQSNMPFFNSNHNNFFAPNGDAVFYSPEGNLSLAAWRLSSGFDQQSIAADPLFSRPDSLYINQAALDSSGISVSQVPTDIDGLSRKTTPTIGAQEITFLPDDLSVVAILAPESSCNMPDSAKIQIRIANNGSSAQGQFTITLVFEGDTLQALFPDTITGGGNRTFTFMPNFYFGDKKGYPIKVWTTLASDSNPNNDTLTRTLFNQVIPILITSNDTTICEGDQANIRVAGGASYQWSNGATGGSVFVQPTQTTTYYVTSVNAFGCAATDSVTVTVTDPAASGQIMQPFGATICSGDSLLLIAQTTSPFKWSNGMTGDSIYLSNPGSIRLLLDAPGSACDERELDMLQVQVLFDSLQIMGNGLASVCMGDPVILRATGFVSGLWSTGDTTAQVTLNPFADTTVYVTWTNAGGCTISDSLTIAVLPAQPPAVPTNLTPVDATIGVEGTQRFSWTPATNASVYDFYLWEAGSNRPAGPTMPNQTGINLTRTNLAPDKTFFWQVASRNSCFTTFSDTLSFSTVGQPDLIVDSIAIPSAVLSGTQITVTYRVRNIGTRTTGPTAWFDHIWLSSDEDLRRADDLLLLKVPNVTFLDTGQSYLNTVTVQLPKEVLSTQLLFVSADNDDAYCATPNWVCFPGAPRRSHSNGTIRESREDNNFLWDTLYITPSPLPDIVISSMGAPLDAFSGDIIRVQYNVKNAGTADADILGMADCFFVSQDSVLTANAISVVPITPTPPFSTASGRSGRVGGRGSSSSGSVPTTAFGQILSGPTGIMLKPDSTRSRDISFQLPRNIFGTYYIIGYADCNDKVFEGFREGNNQFSVPINLTLQPPPDLVVDTIWGPDSTGSGQTIYVNWRIENIGGTNPTPSWTDSAYLCSTPVLNMDSVIWQGSRRTFGPAAFTSVGGSTGSGGGGSGGSGSGSSGIITVPQPSGYAINIPNGISGDYYLFVRANAGGQVFEFNLTQNNLGRKDSPIQITLSPSPDLTIASYSDNVVDDTLRADSIVRVTYTLANIGQAAARPTWRDRIFFSGSPTSITAGSRTVHTFSHSNILNQGDSLVITRSFLVPSNLSQGLHYIHVFTDADDQIYEHQAEHNNTISSVVKSVSGYVFKPRPPAPAGGTPTPQQTASDLEALAVSGPPLANSGQSISVNWSARNNGPNPANGNWTDRIYLSPDTMLNGNEVTLANRPRNDNLGVGASYQTSFNVQIPNGIQGPFYILTEIASQRNIANNVDPNPNNQVAYYPIQVALSPSPDLVVDTMILPTATIYGGQQFFVPYTIRNIGVAPISGSRLRNRISLSNAPSPGTTGIGSDDDTRTVLPGQTYSDSILVSIPNWATGNYFIVFRVNEGNLIYEHQGFHNNVASRLVFIEPLSAQAGDLAMVDVDLPDTLWLGEQFDIPYAFTNIGLSNLSGSLRDGLFLGQFGQALNPSLARLAATKEGFVNALPGDTVSRNFTQRLQRVQTGTFTGFARLNINAALPEIDFSNNNLAGTDPLVIDARELTIAVPDTNELRNDKPVYYKVELAADQDLLITLTSFDSRTGINEVYVAYDRVPDESNFDFSHTPPPGLNQQVLVPETRAGYYYIFIRSQNSFSQDIEVLAEQLPFSILQLNPDQVGQGPVSTRMTGAGFRTGMEVNLLGTNGAIAASATISQFVSSMEVDLRWDLSQVPTGVYDVQCLNPDSSIALLPQGLQIDSSTGYKPYVYVNAPNLIRSGKTAFFTFYVENAGNIDIPFFHGEVSVPDYANISSMLKTNPKIWVPSDFASPQDTIEDWKIDARVQTLPVVVKDLRPGEFVSLDVTFSNFLAAQFPYRVRGTAASGPDFVAAAMQQFEQVRQAILANQGIIPDPDILDWLLDQEAYADSMLVFMIESGLIDPADTIGFTVSCAKCGSAYDFSPGGSVGTDYYMNLELKAGQKMLWEINHPEGAAGDELGWDLMQANGIINITATAADPFSIDLKTLSSWDNSPDYLTTWSPGYDFCWPIMTAGGGILGFDSTKFVLNEAEFVDNTPIHGGQFELRLSPNTDTLYLCFVARIPNIGEKGIPGGPGQWGMPGGRGGPGGPCGPNTPPGDGGDGGIGGDGVTGWLLPGNGGAGGPGGLCASGQYPGGKGGEGGEGGFGDLDQPGADGGDGGSGGFPGGRGGTGGRGGDAAAGAAAGGGGRGGRGGNSGFNNPRGPGGDGGDGGRPLGPKGPGGDGDPTGPDGDDGDNNNPNADPRDPKNNNDPRPGTRDRPRTEPRSPGPPGGPRTPTRDRGREPIPPRGSPERGPAGCGGGSSGGSAGLSACDYFNAATRAAGCGTTVQGCASDLAGSIARSIVYGPKGMAARGVLSVATCGLGMYNCATGGGAFSNCLEAGLSIIGDIVDRKPSAGSAAAAGGCANSLFCDDRDVVASCDPNEIVGPTGFGPDRMVAHDEVMEYTIFFENDPVFATAAAQRVIITQDVHPNMNPFRLKLTGFGFANLDFTIPTPGTNYTTTVDVTDSLGVDVQLTGGYDIVNNRLFWIFQSIDKQTGLAPQDPLAGFLAVNDSTAIGEGYVKYTIEPLTGSVVTGDSITAQAEIVFDINSSIITNKEFNIIDAAPPISHLDTLPAVSDVDQFPICWTAEDDLGGSGVDAYELFVSENNGPWLSLGTFVSPDSCYQFTGKNNTQYDFYIRAIDNVGNLEAEKTLEAGTFISISNLRMLAPSDTVLCVSDSVGIEWAAGGVNPVSLLYAQAGSANFQLIATNLDSTQSPFVWNIPQSLANGYYRFRVMDTAGFVAHTGDSVLIGKAPDLQFGPVQPVCLGDSVQLMVNGADSVYWELPFYAGNPYDSVISVIPVQSGYFAVTGFDQAGCSSRDSIFVEVLQPDSVMLFDVTCDSTLAGMVSMTFQNQFGCDSVVSTYFTYVPPVTGSAALSICDGDSVFVGGNWQAIPGNYVDVFVAASGCDSIVTTNLMVLPNTQGSQIITICDGDSAFAGGAWQVTSGNYLDVYPAANGCDSLVTTHIQVLPNATGNQTLNICDGDSAFAGGAWQILAGTYTDVFLAANGCDSVVTTTLNVLPNASSSQTLTICDGDSTFAGGDWQFASGIYLDLVPAANGCDSMITTTIVVLPNTTGVQSLTICDGDSTFAGGAWQTTAGTYTDVFPAANGCDSTVTTTLNVQPNAVGTQTVTICDGDSTFAGSAWQTATGSYTDVFPAANGCDSVFTTTLIVLPNASGVQSATICDGDSAFAGGGWQTIAGVYTDVNPAANGCDSVVSTTLHVLPHALHSQMLTICEGDSVFVENQWQTTSGTYTDIFPAANGCDSILTTTLQVLPNATANQLVAICEGDSVFAGNAWQTQSGNYVDMYPASNGCDSVVTTQLMVMPHAFVQTQINLCSGDSAFVGGLWQTASGIFVDTLLGSNGCDSVVETSLTINPVVTITNQVTICDGDSAFIMGHWRFVSGVFVDSISSQTGCDSIVTTNLLVNPHASGMQAVTICDGDSAFAGGNWQMTSGNYVDVYPAANGCDSIVTTALNVLPNATGTQTLSICDGDSAFAGGAWQTTAGTYTDVFPAANGCDSTVTTTLSVLPNATGTQTLAICDGDSAFAGGAWQTTAGTYTDVFQAANGCDSTVTTTLNVLPNATGAQTLTICDGDSAFAGGSWQTIAGSYTDVFPAANGCDSTVTTTLNVLPNATGSRSLVICDGDSAFAGGAWQTTAGTYTDVFPAANGCDSVVTTQLAVLPNPQGSSTLAICQGDSAFVGGGWQSLAGAYVDTLLAANGCDSILMTTLIVNPVYQVPVNLSICQGDSAFLGGAWRTASGVFIDSLSSTAGCDSVVNTTLLVSPVHVTPAQQTICRGDSVFLGGAWRFVPGIYADTLSTGSGCDSLLLTTLNVFAVDTSVTVTNNTLTANLANVSYQWIDCLTNQAIPTETGRSFTPLVNGVYAVAITDQGCTDTSGCHVISNISLNEIFLRSLTYHPNPTRDFVRVSFGGQRGTTTISVIDLTGKQVAVKNYGNTDAANVDLSELPSGEYKLIVHFDGYQAVLKVVKQH